MGERFHFNVFHHGDTDVKEKITEFDCVERVSIQVTIPISEDKINLDDPHRSAISVTVNSKEDLKLLDSQLQDNFKHIWFKS